MDMDIWTFNTIWIELWFIKTILRNCKVLVSRYRISAKTINSSSHNRNISFYTQYFHLWRDFISVWEVILLFYYSQPELAIIFYVYDLENSKNAKILLVVSLSVSLVNGNCLSIIWQISLHLLNHLIVS